MRSGTISRRQVLSASLALATCMMPASAQTVTTAAPPTPVKVVATFSILADLTRNIGSTRIIVESLVGTDGDAHVFSPTPADARKLADANLIIINGLKFEGWIDRLIKASGSKGTVVTTSKGIKSIASASEMGHGHSHDHGGMDPHAWQDVANAKVYVSNIRDGLIAVDPAGRTEYENSATKYLEQLDVLDSDIRQEMSKIPAQRRRIVTSHDAFAYFERAYGLNFRSPRGVSTDSEASARDVGRIIRQIKAENIPAIFLENVSDPRLIERIAKETSAVIGGKLFSDALSPPSGPAPTYIDMMRHNIRMLGTALIPKS